MNLKEAIRLSEEFETKATDGEWGFFNRNDSGNGIATGDIGAKRGNGNVSILFFDAPKDTVMDAHLEGMRVDFELAVHVHNVHMKYVNALKILINTMEKYVEYDELELGKKRTSEARDVLAAIEKV